MLAQEVRHQLVEFAGALHLGPVAAMFSKDAHDKDLKLTTGLSDNVGDPAESEIYEIAGNAR